MTKNKTTLYDAHIKLNAKMGEFAGYEMPLNYKHGSLVEIKSVRTNIGIFDVSHMGQLFIEGDRSEDFLNLLVTNNLSQLIDGKAQYNLICNESGTVIDDVICYKFSSKKYMVCANASNFEKVFTHFKKMRDSSVIQERLNDSLSELILVNLSEDYSLIAIQGPNTLSEIVKLEFFKEYFPGLETLKKFHFHEYKDSHRQISTLVARTGYTGEDGVEVFCPHEQAKKLWEELISCQIQPCGLVARDILRIEAGYPLYGQEFDEQLSPFDASVGWAVKMNKSYFVGQEALKNKHTPSQYVFVKFRTKPLIARTNMKILNQSNKEIGIVTSGGFSPTLNSAILMARIKREDYIEDSNFFVQIRNKAQSLEKVTSFL